MMRGMDFTSWQGILSTVLGLALITLIGVGVRLLAMTTIQQRRERENRQINERLKTLIAAYKVLGGSFTGDLAVDPTHLRQLRERGEDGETSGSDRSRRTRDAVEAALSDIILLGTDEQVRLAATAASELAEGRPVHTAELVVSLRDFVRKALTLDPIPDGLVIPRQGPARPSQGGGRGGGQRDGGARDGGRDGGGRGGGRGGGGGMGGAAGGAGMGMGMGVGLAVDDGPAEGGDKTA